jgi:hypothetical protein
MLALVFFVACSGGTLPSGPNCPGPMASSTNPTLVIARRPVTVSFDFTQECEAPSSIEGSVLDPASQPLADARLTLTGFHAEVTFTPTGGGPYHVSARFQPNRGLGQADVLSAADRNDETGLEVAGFGCELAELTDAGLVVCLRADAGVFQLSGAALRAVQSLDGFGLVQPRGEVLWTSSPVARLVAGTQGDGGPGYREPPDADGGDTAVRLWATHDDALAQVGDRLRLYTIGDGGLSFTDVGKAPDGGAVHRVGSQLVVVEVTRDCVQPLDGGDARCADVPSFNLPLIDGDDTGMWLGKAGSPLLVRHGVGTGEISEFNVPTPWGLAVHAGEVPRIQNGEVNLIPAPDRLSIELEYWGALHSATVTTVMTSTDAGTVLLRRR